MSELSDITFWQITKLVATIIIPIGIVIAGFVIGRFLGELAAELFRNGYSPSLEFIGALITTIASIPVALWTGLQIAATI